MRYTVLVNSCSRWGRVGDSRQRPKLLLVLEGWLGGFQNGGRDSSVGIATRYGLDSQGIESRWGSRFSEPVQTGPWAHPTSYTVGTGFLSRG